MSRAPSYGYQSGLTQGSHDAIIDATGRFVTPGLINANVHLAMNGLADGRHWTTIASRFESHVADYARLSLRNGLTTVRDMWGPTDALIAVGDRIARGELTGSRIVTSGLIVQHPGLLRRLASGWTCLTPRTSRIDHRPSRSERRSPMKSNGAVSGRGRRRYAR